ncbi:MAG TPA: response regulator [Phycisphaerae bacterium]|nr:response regulator [Phycisphaerae bacterium]
MANKTILLIDDDADIHEAVKMILEPAGYQVECALTGPAGLDSARKRAPDLILLDIMLDTPSEGFHLAYELRKDDELKKIPIIIISSIGKTMGMDYAKELGSDYVPVNQFLDKPFDATTLRNAVQKALGGTK